MVLCPLVVIQSMLVMELSLSWWWRHPWLLPKLFPEGCCPVDPTCLTWHWSCHTLQLCPQVRLLFVPASPSSPWWIKMQCLGVCMYWLGPGLCLWSGFSRQIHCSPLEPLHHWLRSTVDTVFCRPLWIIITYGFIQFKWLFWTCSCFL